MRKYLKRVAELGLVRSGLARIGRSGGGRKAVILAYHNVVPSGHPRLGDSSLHLPVDEFRNQLDLLDQCFDLVPLRRILAGEPGEGRPLAAITFDDSYRGTVDIGIPELLGRGLPATVFVPPGLLGASAFWWDVISDAKLGGIRPAVRDFALRELGGRQSAILEWASSQGLIGGPLPELYRPVGEEEARELARLPGISLGSHTWSHVNLSRVPPEEAQAELNRSLEWLEGTPSFERVVSYPYGAWDPGLTPSMQRAGFHFGLLIQGGLTPVSSVRSTVFSVPRLNIPRGLSAEGFLVRVSGVWPA
jgi:peptidoglycan/xylan/chitin deacetylase (PgdA/CDA1 family)